MTTPLMGDPFVLQESKQKTGLTDKDHANKVKHLNNRPRKRLKFQTPKEVYLQALRGALAT